MSIFHPPWIRKRKISSKTLWYRHRYDRFCGAIVHRKQNSHWKQNRSLLISRIIHCKLKVSVRCEKATNEFGKHWTLITTESGVPLKRVVPVHYWRSRHLHKAIYCKSFRVKFCNFCVFVGSSMQVVEKCRIDVQYMRHKNRLLLWLLMCVFSQMDIWCNWNRNKLAKLYNNIWLIYDERVSDKRISSKSVYSFYRVQVI